MIERELRVDCVAGSCNKLRKRPIKNLSSGPDGETRLLYAIKIGGEKYCPWVSKPCTAGIAGGEPAQCHGLVFRIATESAALSCEFLGSRRGCAAIEKYPWEN